MAAVNWLCLVVLAFAFINNIICIKVDTNLANGNNTTTINLNSQTLLQHKSTSSSSNNNEPDNITLLGDSELSASERTRRLIPYMAFYLPVSDLPINKQYANNNNIQTAKQVARPSATGNTGPTGSHIPLPEQYVHLKITATGPGHNVEPYIPPATSSLQYHPSAGEVYHTLTYGGGQQQSQFHILPSSSSSAIKHNDGGSVGGGASNKYPGQSHHVLPLPSGPSGPSASSVLSSPVGGKGNGNNAFVTYKEINPIRHKTVQHFPPLSSTSSTLSSSSSSSSAYETIRHQQQQQQQPLHHQQQQQQKLHGISGGIYRPRTKQSKINLTPFTPSNTVPGNFVPIVYTPVNSNNNNNVQQTETLAGGTNSNDDTILNEDEKQYHKQQQQIALEYSSGPLPPSASAIDVQQQQEQSLLLPPHRHFQHQQHHHQQQQQHNHHTHHNPKQQSQYFSVTTSPLSAANVDLTHEEGAVGISGGTASGNAAVNAQHHHNTQTISSPPTIIYHQQQQQPDHVIIDASVRPSQQPHQQQQQQQYRSKPIQFSPPKPESFFESEQQQLHHEHQQQQQQQHHNIEQVLKDVNSYETKNSHMTTPQEKYVMYLQHQIRYNKHQQHQQKQQQQQHELIQQQHHAAKQIYREHNNKEREQQYVKQQQQQHHQQSQSQQHNAQFFVLSSTASPHDTVTALSPIRHPQNSHFSPNYPQHSPAHHALYPRPDLNLHDAPPQTTHSQQSINGEQIVTIPVHSLFGDLDTLQHKHFSQHSQASSHNSQYPKKIGPSTPQYIDYLIDEPKQALDEEQNAPPPPPNHHQQQQQLETLRPTLGPPPKAFVIVSTPAPFAHDTVTQGNYGSTLRPPFKNKPKIRLQPVLQNNNINYPIIRPANPTGRPQVLSITPNTINEDGVQAIDETPKYVYVKEEFGQKLTAAGAVKLKPSNRYESDNQIPQRQQHFYQQQQQHSHNIPLQPLAPRPPTPPVLDKEQHYHNQHNTQQQPTEELEVAVTDVEQQQQQPIPPKSILADPNELPDIRTSSLAEILHKLQESNHLPHTLTPDNIDNSIKTLIRILNNLKLTQTIVANPPQHHETPTSHASSSPDDYDYTTGSEEQQQQQHPPPQQPENHQQPEHPSSNDLSLLTPAAGPNKHPGPSTGRPGIDYPNYAEIPQTLFDCTEQRYKGFFGDPETNCQVWHYCDLNGGKASFLCPNGTIFSQIALTCDWWFNVKCGTTTQLYVLNERLYKYILPFTPKFPEDYSGPIVDKYLAMKFQEMEEKMRLEKEKVLQAEAEASATEEKQQNHPNEATSEDSKEDNHLEETTTEDSNRHLKSPTAPPVHHKHESVNSQVSEQSKERNQLIDDEVDDISQRGTIDNFDSTTIATLTATAKSEHISFNLKPIIVSSTIGPDYDEEQTHNEIRRRHENQMVKDTIINKTEQNNNKQKDNEAIAREETVINLPEQKSSGSLGNMQITVEKVDVIEIKPDGATGHLIRDMLRNSNQK